MQQFTLFIIALLIAGCATTVPPTKTTDQLCSELNLLIRAYDNNFEQFKRTKRPTRLMDIWQTDFHFVGQACEIWDWGIGRVDYMCNRAFPNQETALERYESARIELQSCLVGWQATESERKISEGKKLVFRKGDSLPIVSVHIINSADFYRSQWSAYVFIGDENKDL